MRKQSFTECPAAYQYAPRTDASYIDAACPLHRFDAPKRHGAGTLLAYSVALVLVCAASAFMVF